MGHEQKSAKTFDSYLFISEIAHCFLKGNIVNATEEVSGRLSYLLRRFLVSLRNAYYPK